MALLLIWVQCIQRQYRLNKQCKIELDDTYMGAARMAALIFMRDKNFLQ